MVFKKLSITLKAIYINKFKYIMNEKCVETIDY